MNETELESMIVRLMGDGKSYMQMLQQAQQSTQQVAQGVEAATQRIEGMSRGISTFVTTAISTLGMLGLAATFTGAVHAAGELEQSMMRLTAAVEASGQSITSVMPEYQRFTAEMERMTTASGASIRNLLTRAEVMGFHNKQAENMAKLSIALGGAFQGEASSYAHLAAMIQSGNTYRLHYLIPTIRHNASESEKLAEINRILMMGWRLSEEESKTFSGTLTRLHRDFYELSNQIGEIFLPHLKALAKVGETVAKWFRDMSPETKRLAAEIIGLTLAIIALPPALYIINGLLSILHVSELASLALIVAKTAAMLPYNLAWWLINTAIGAYNALMTASITLTVIQTGAFLLAIPIAVGLGVAIYALVRTAIDLVAAFREVQNFGEFFAKFSGFFEEWKTIFGDIINALQTDMPLAQKIITTAFYLAISEIQDQWTPLWDYIKKGFTAVAIFTKYTLISYLAEAISFFLAGMVKGMGLLGMVVSPLVDALAEKMELDAKFVRDRAFKNMKADIETANREFQFAPASEATKALQVQLADLHNQLQALMKDQQPKEPPPMISNLQHAQHHAEKLQAALISSADAVTRLQEYMDRLSIGQYRETSTPNNVIAVSVGSNAPTDKQGMIADRLLQIKEAIEKQGKNPNITFKPANLS